MPRIRPVVHFSDDISDNETIENCIAVQLNRAAFDVSEISRLELFDIAFDLKLGVFIGIVTGSARALELNKKNFLRFFRLS